MGAAAVCEGAMINARIRFEESDAMRQCGKSLCLATTVVQTGGDFLVLEPYEFTAFQPANPNGKVFAPEGSVSGGALTHMKELGWSFEIADAGRYDVWLRAWFPLAAGYNHSEQMDDGETLVVNDSVDGAKIDKFEALPGANQMADKWLQPKMWHWFKNHPYDLSAGRHVFRFPANGAWCGGCLLDRIVLVKQGSAVNAEEAGKTHRRVVRARSATLLSRRIRTDRIAAWTFETSQERGGGDIALEYFYGGETGRTLEPGKVYAVPENSGYLYIRFRFTAAETGFQPLVYSYRFRVEKKPK